MKQYICTICAFIYDEEKGFPEADIPPGTVWADVPETFGCPVCGASKEDFKELIPDSSN